MRFVLSEPAGVTSTFLPPRIGADQIGYPAASPFPYTSCLQVRSELEKTVEQRFEQWASTSIGLRLGPSPHIHLQIEIRFLKGKI